MKFDFEITPILIHERNAFSDGRDIKWMVNGKTGGLDSEWKW